MFDAMLEKTKVSCSEEGLEDSGYRVSSSPSLDNDSHILLEETRLCMASNDHDDGDRHLESHCQKPDRDNFTQQLDHKSTDSHDEGENPKNAFSTVKDASLFMESPHLKPVDELDIMKNSSASLSSSYLLAGASRSTINSLSSTLSMSTGVEDCAALSLKNRSLVEPRRPLSISSSFSSSSRSTTSSSSGHGDSLPRGLSWAVFPSEEAEASVGESAAHGRKLSGADTVDSGVSSPEGTSYLTPTGSLGHCDSRPELTTAVGSTLRVNGGDYCARVVEELVKTEADYVRDLQQVLEGYLFYWRENPQPCLTEEKLSALFLQLREVAECNSEFLMLLGRAGNDPVLVSQCFMKHAQKFTVYIAYCTDYPSTLGVLSGLMRCEESAVLFRERQQSLGHPLPLGSYLLKPVQRILKYRLLLENMLSDSEGVGDASETVKGALATMSRLAELINDMKRRHELAVRVQEIQSILYLWPGADLTTYGELLAEGAFRVPRARNWRHLFLFESMLLITKRRANSTLIHKCHIMCSNLMLTEVVSRDPCMFQVLPFDNPKQQTTLQARTLEQKNEWTLLLKRAILHSFEAKIPGHARELVMKLGQQDPLSRQSRKAGKQMGSRNLVPEYLQRRHGNQKIRLLRQPDTEDEQHPEGIYRTESLDDDPPPNTMVHDSIACRNLQESESITETSAGAHQNPSPLYTPRRKTSLSSLTSSTRLSVRRSLMLLRRQSEPLLASLSTSLSAVSASPSIHSDLSDNCGRSQYVDMTSSMISLQERAIDAGQCSPSALTIHTDGMAEYVSFADYDVTTTSASTSAALASDKQVQRASARWHLRRSCRRSPDSQAAQQRELPFTQLMGSWRKKKHVGARRSSLFRSTPSSDAGCPSSWQVGSLQQNCIDASCLTERQREAEVDDDKASEALPNHRVYGERVSPLTVHRLVDTVCEKLNSQCSSSCHPDYSGDAADYDKSDFYEQQLDVLEQMASSTRLEVIASDDEEISGDPATTRMEVIASDEEVTGDSAVYSDSDSLITAAKPSVRDEDTLTLKPITTCKNNPNSWLDLTDGYTKKENCPNSSHQSSSRQLSDEDIQRDNCSDKSNSTAALLEDADSHKSQQSQVYCCPESEALIEDSDVSPSSPSQVYCCPESEALIEDSDVSPSSPSSVEIGQFSAHESTATPSVLQRQLTLTSSCHTSRATKQFSIGTVKKLSERCSELARCRESGRVGGVRRGSRLPLSSGWVQHVVGKMETDSAANAPTY